MVEDKIVDLGETREIELPKFDADEYVGKEVTIEKATTHEGAFGNYVRVETCSIPNKDPAGMAFTVRENFGLQKDKDGNIGWGKETKLGKFLAKMGVEHYDGLKGKIIKLQTKMVDDKEYLTLR